MKKIDLDSIFHHSDHSQKGHGLTLTKVYRSYKNSPHNVDATYGKYLVHRLENADKYESASPQEKFKMDIDFLDHHQKGSAADKNGHMTADHLESFMLNPDTPKLAKQLLNHKKQLADFIQKEHPEHIVNINGEPHLRLTRGLNVDRAGRGADHALASYADIPDTGFGTHMHHQLVPLKNVWFAYDYGPKAATSKKHGNENEFLVSPHQNVYNEEHTKNPTKPIAVRSHHSLKANDFRFKSFNKKMSQQEVDNFVNKNPSDAAEYLHNHPLFNASHIDTIVQKHPPAAAKYLHNHPLLNTSHIDSIVKTASHAAAEYLHNHPLLNTSHINFLASNASLSAARHLKDHHLFNINHINTIVQNNPSAAAGYLYNHPLFNKQHVDTIVKNSPIAAVTNHNFYSLLDASHLQTVAKNNSFVAAQWLKHHPLLNEQHIDTIVQNNPKAAAYYLKDHPIYQAKYGNKVQKSLQKSTKISKQLSDKVRQLLNSKAVLNKTRGTLKFPKILPKDTRPEENVKQVPKDEPEHQQYGGLFTVKPAEQQFIQAALAGASGKEKHREAPQIRQQIHGGGLGGAYTLKTKQAFAFNPAFHIKAHEGLHSLVGKAAQKLQVNENDVYNHLNSLIHPEDQAKLKATLSAYDYKPHTHPAEMIPRISDILHDKKIRSAFLNQHYPIDQDWSTFNPNTLTSGFHDPNVKAGWQAIQRLGRTWNAIVKMGKELERLP